MLKKFKAGKYIVLAMVLILGLSLAGCKKDEAKSEVVATVDNINITKDELYDLLVEQYGAQTLDALISDKIIELEVAKNKVEISSEEVDKEVESMANYYGGMEALDNAMKSYNMTMEDMKDNVKMNLSLKKLVGSNIIISDEEIVSYFEENKEKFNQEEQVSASHILVESEELAKEIREKLVAGEDIAELAKEYSTDEGTKNNGGNLGFFGRGEMVESFDKAAFTLNIGEISEPIKSNYGYHVIIVNEKKEAKLANLEDSKDDIKEMLLEAQIPEAFNEWYEQKITEYKVTNKLQNK